MLCAQRSLTARPCATACRSRPVVLRAVSTTSSTKAAAAAAEEQDITAADVASLLTTLTASDMQIAELHLEMGDVELRVRRSLADEPAPAPAPAAPAMASVIAPTPHLSPALRLAQAPAFASMDEYGAEESMDESLLYVTANRVGIFRRGKSKAKVGDQVKKGQVLGAIEQLGTVVDVKSPQEGEIVEFKAKDGDPVEYGGHIVALAPYFNLEDAGKTSARGLI